ncbi:uncharacterized protein TNIN_135691 [Trichonephila inaurata madagascariensis]|uniref:Uncharacterized protein n=1 Tax=Trichonephila inaurata madagascariensis TaxID=2747483 RepID=A0A8X6X6X2_9ARAC|nr:uncharacterized protein TNIN_135691 [Trichonephila inaurata madagascariensis]
MRLINENYFEAHDNIFIQWESEDIIEALPIDQLAKEVHYLPHRPVIKPSNNTTKVRPVFDASLKKPGFDSLNECLSWIKKKEPWNTFVGNRVKEIWDLTNIDDWRHVPGEVNPADLVTRCCDWSDLLKSKWLEGPGWLYSDEESWPCSEVSETPD